MRVEPVKGADGYFVSDYGDVFNAQGRQLRPALNRKTGYVQLPLNVAPKKRKCFYIHRLVAEAFVPNPTGLSEVNHIDGDKQNNTADNLEWVTRSGNVSHAYQVGLRPTVSVVAYTTDGKKFRTFPSIKEAAAFCGSNHRSHIHACLSGKEKTAHGYIWKYAAGGAEP